MNPKVDFYFEKNEQWQKAIEKQRAICLKTGLDEALKWGSPCYMLNNSNIVLIHVFKEYCALLFFKGALLKDTDSLLVQPTENVQAARQLRFTNVKDVTKLEKIIAAYIYQAIEVEKAGLKVTLKKVAEFAMAAEFETKLNKSAALKKAFYALTPGRQRAYLLHFSQPKQSKTREARVEKCAPDILKGKGLNDM